MLKQMVWKCRGDFIEIQFSVKGNNTVYLKHLSDRNYHERLLIKPIFLIINNYIEIPSPSKKRWHNNSLISKIQKVLK